MIERVNKIIQEADLFLWDYIDAGECVSLLRDILSRLQIAEEALTEIKALTEWAKDEHRQDRERIIYHEAREALEQIRRN